MNAYTPAPTVAGSWEESAQTSGLSSFPETDDVVAEAEAEVRALNEATLGLHEAGDAQRVIDATWSPVDSHPTLIYVDGLGFVRYSGGAWSPVTDAEVAGLVAEVMADHHADALRDLERLDRRHQAETDARRRAGIEGERKAVQARVTYFARRRTQRAAENVTAMLKGSTAIRRDIRDLNRHEHLLVVANGTVDLRTGELREHDPRLMLTGKVEVPYDPEISTADIEASEWLRFLRSCHPDDPEVVEYLQRLYGYGLTGSTDEQCFVLHVGRGSNGKGVFSDVILHTFGGVSKVLDWRALEQRSSGNASPDLARLFGARLVIAQEGDLGTRLDEAQLKNVTGQDVISARRLYRDPFEFRPSFLLTMVTNHLPAFRDQTDGLWRRVRLVLWTQRFDRDADPGLRRRLKAEGPVVLAWAVRGAMAWYENGLSEPASIVAAVEEYRADEDDLAGFLADVLVEADPEERVLLKEAHRAYLDWLPEAAGKPMSLKALKKALNERGLTISKTNKGQAVFGRRLAVTAADDLPFGKPLTGSADLKEGR